MIQGTKQEYDCVAGKSTTLTRDVEYFLQTSHPRKLAKNDFGATVLSHKTVDDWEFVKVKEILLERDGHYCLVNYMQNVNKKMKISANPCVYVAEPVNVPFIKQEGE